MVPEASVPPPIDDSSELVPPLATEDNKRVPPPDGEADVDNDPHA